MLKRILIISGAVILTLLILAWGYLLFFGVPSGTKDTFTNLGILGSTEERPTTTEDTTTQLAPSTSLQQLTTKPVAGFVHIADPVASSSSSTVTTKSLIRYAERGTGHVYEIDLNTGIEIQISPVTVGQTVEAYFSPDGEQVVLVSENNQTVTGTLLQIDSDTPTKPLPANSTNFGWTGDLLHYTISNGTETTAYTYEAETATIAWQTTMTDLDVYWQTSGDIIINKPAPELRGGIFRIENNQLEVLVSPQYALYGFVNKAGNSIFYSYFETEDGQPGMIHKLYSLTNNTETELALPNIADKCVINTGQTDMWCTLSEEFLLQDKNTINEWYRGEISSNDNLWRTNLNTPEEATYEADLSGNTGYSLDTVDLTLSDDDSCLFFRNKINDTLWKYELK